MNWIYFSIAAAIGAVLRFKFEKWSVHNLGERFPYGTLAANVFGSFLLGFTLSRTNWNTDLVLFSSSFCGAFTTFGGFVGQSHQRLRHKAERSIAIIYIFLTVGLSLFAAWVGLST